MKASKITYTKRGTPVDGGRYDYEVLTVEVEATVKDDTVDAMIACAKDTVRKHLKVHHGRDEEENRGAIG